MVNLHQASVGRGRRLVAAAALAAAAAVPGVAAAQAWDAPVSGNWSDGSKWTGGQPPASGDTTALTFGASGAASYTATNDLGAFTLNSLTFNNAGTGTITVAGTTALTFADSPTGTTPTLAATGTNLMTAPIAGSATVTKTGPGTVLLAGNSNGFNGTLILNGGRFASVNPAGTGAHNFNAVSIVVNSGATYQFGDATIGDPNLPNSTYITVNTGGTVFWDEGEVFGGFNLFGGTLTLRQGPSASGGTPTELRSGTINVDTNAPAIGGSGKIRKTTTGTVTVVGASLNSTGGLEIDEGVLSTNAPLAGASTATVPNNVTLGTASTTGTLEYTGGSGTIARPFVFNAGGGVIRVTDPAATVTASAAVSGTGGFEKAGQGTFRVTGAMSQTGNVAVTGGTLALAGALNQTGSVTAGAGATVQVNPVTSAGGFAAAGGGTLAVASGPGTASFTTPTLALGSGGGNSTLRFDLGTAAAPANPLVVVSADGGLTTGGGTHTLLVTNTQALAVGTYTLIDYAGAPITSGFTAPLPGRTAGSLQYDAANTQIKLNVTGTDSIKWTGAVNQAWDVGTAPGAGGTNNFQLVQSGTATNFIDTDTVLFDDTAGPKTVNVAGTVQPASVTVNTAATYTFQGGGGAIAGAGTLTKQGAGTLVLLTDNTYTGATTVAAGTLRVGNGGTTGAVGGGNVALADGTALEFNRSGALTVGGSITGTGSITKTGDGTVHLLGNNTVTGPLTINAGTVHLNDLGAGGDLFSTVVTVNNGGKFIFGGNGNPDMPEGEANASYLTANPGGEIEWRTGEQIGGLNLKGGTLTLNGSAPSLIRGLTTTPNPTTPSVWESGTIVGVTTSAVGGSQAVIKTTPGTVLVTGGASVEPPITIQDGTVAFAAANNLGGNPLTFEGGAVEYRGATAARAGELTLSTAGGTVRVTDAGTRLTLSGSITGDGALTKAGAGGLVLTGLNGYTGGTTVSAGTLLVNNPATDPSATGTGSGPVTVAAGATVGGTGSIAGPLTVGGTLAPGTSPGRLTLAGAGTMQPTSTFLAELGSAAADPVAGTDYDQLALTGTGTTLTLAPGAKLQIVELPGIVNGQQFTIVDNTAGGTLSGTFANAAGSPLANNATLTGTNGSLFRVNYAGGDVILTTVNAVPEPASVAVVGLAAVGLLCRRGRGRRACR